MSYKVGDLVWFHAPKNVNRFDHGLDSYQVVEAHVVYQLEDGWYCVEYDGGREISAAESELSPRTGVRRRKLSE